MSYFWPAPVWGVIFRAYYSYSFFFNLLICRFKHFRGQALQSGIDLVFTVPHNPPDAGGDGRFDG